MSIQPFDPPGGGGFSKDGEPAPEILIAIYSAEIRMRIQRALRESGYRVRLAATAREAQAEIELDAPALLVTDPRMPRGDGWALIIHCVIHFPEIPVLIYSADRSGSPKPVAAGAGTATSSRDLSRLCAEVRRLAPIRHVVTRRQKRIRRSAG